MYLIVRSVVRFFVVLLFSVSYFVIVVFLRFLFPMPPCSNEKEREKNGEQ